MAAWPHDLCEKLQRVVKLNAFMGANEEFNSLKTAVLKSTPSELAAQARHAGLVWEFLIGFAGKKAFYRSHVVLVVKALMAAAGGWPEAYSGNAALRLQAAALHEELQAVLGSDGLPEQPASASVAGAGLSAAIGGIRSPGAAGSAAKNGKPVVWPEWSTLEAIVRMDRFMSANDEFANLRAAVLAADPVQLASQVAHAGMLWMFLIGFAERKSFYRSHVAEVANALRLDAGWSSGLEAIWPDVEKRVKALPGNLPAAFGCEGCENKEEEEEKAPSPDAKGKPSSDKSEASVQKVEDLAREVSVTGNTEVARPNEKSLDERLSAMLGGDHEDSQEPAKVVAEQGLPQSLLQDPITSSQSGSWEEAAPAVTGGAAAPVPLSGLPDVLKTANPFLQRAKEQEATQPLISHYLRIHALELLIGAKQRGETTPEADALLFSTFSEAEAKKASLDLTDGPSQMEAFALRSFDSAVANDVSGLPVNKLPVQLYVASLFVDALAQFHTGILPPHLLKISQYAKGRALHIRECLQRGVEPSPPAPPEPLPAPPRMQSPARPDTAPTAAPVPAPAPAASTAFPVGPIAPVAPAAAPAVADPPAVPSTAAVPQAVAAPSLIPPAVIPVLRPEFAGLTRSKKLAEARKKSDLAVSALESDDTVHARAHILAALSLIEGLT
ncbi:unnamed protein product [Polarella glacialis]|uniref:Vta1/callose synthase N-terminal domain-containing protein n=1 Tax=Polarella glacialis TaxID=89957 RepID=A0A813KF06_POLGL|nr:unnamed protein product [Polarella glacialis]